MDSSEGPFKRILVAVDGSENAKKAAGLAIGLAGVSGSELLVLCVVPVPVALATGMAEGGIAPGAVETFYEEADKKARAIADGVVSAAEKRGVKARTEVFDNPVSPVEAIITMAAERSVDLVVLGTRGMGGFKKLLLGSVSSGVLTHAPCSVMVVR